MKLSLAPLGALAVLGLVGGAASCADAETEPFAATPTEEGGVVTTPDAPSGPADASPDAAPRTCSVHGFCRTILPASQSLRGVWGDDAGVAWAVSEEGDVLRWDGAAWKVHASGLGALRAIWGSGPTDVWIGGDEGVFHGTGASSAALAFAPSALPGGATRVASIWGAAADDVWAVGTMEGDAGDAQGRVLHYSGGAWVADPASSLGLAYTHVWGGAGTGVWIGGARPMAGEPFDELVVLRREGGAAFAPVALPESGDPFPFGVLATIHGVAVGSSSLVWILGRTTVGLPGIWKGTSADSGKTFTFTHEADGRPDDPAWRALAATGPNDAWAVGEYGRARSWDGAEWATAAITTTSLPVTDPLYAVWTGTKREVWLVGDELALRLDPTKKDGGTP